MAASTVANPKIIDPKPDLSKALPRALRARLAALGLQAILAALGLQAILAALGPRADLVALGW